MCHRYVETFIINFLRCFLGVCAVPLFHCCICSSHDTSESVASTFQTASRTLQTYLPEPFTASQLLFSFAVRRECQELWKSPDKTATANFSTNIDMCALLLPWKIHRQKRNKQKRGREEVCVVKKPHAKHEVAQRQCA